MAVFTVLLLVFIVILGFIYLYKFSKSRPENFPPGPPRLPFWGSYWFILKENYYYAQKALAVLGKRYNTDILGLYLGPFPTVITLSLDLSKEVLTREEFIGRPDTIFTSGRSWGELLGIFFTNGPYWKEQRRFSLRNLRDYGFGRRFTSTEEHFEKEMRDLIDMLMSEPKPEDYDICRKKGQILTPDVFFAPALSSILNMLVSKRFDHRKLRKLGHSTMRFLRSIDAAGCAITMTPWLRYIAPDYFGYTEIINGHQDLMDFMQEQVLEHKNNFSNDLLGDFADTFVNKMKKHESKNKIYSTFSDKQMLWILIDYMFPVPSAISQTLNFIFAYLLNYPEVQTKIQEEIDRVVGRSRIPSLNDRKDMSYTEAVIREVMRKDPTIPLGVPRQCVKDTTLGGYFIPKDTVLLTNIDAAHRDLKVWDDPEVFRPERFLDHEGNLLKKDVTISFGAGKRLCAGETFARQTMFLMLSALLQNFTFKAVDKVPDLNEKIWGFVESKTPFWMEAVSRQ